MRSTQPHHSRRPNRPALRLETLESRLQPNDMFGLGLSLLGLEGLSGTESSTQSPLQSPLLSETSLVSAAADPAQPEQLSFLLTSSPTVETPVAPAVNDLGLRETVFDTVSSKGFADQLFSLEPPATRVPWEPDSVMSALGINKAALPEAVPTIDAHFITLTHMGTSANMNAYGFSNTFSSGTADALFVSGQFFSVGGGPVLETAAANCTIDADIEMLSPQEAYSVITCAGAQILYYHYVDNDLGGWITYMSFIEGTPGCVYQYTDYDVFGDPNDVSDWQPAVIDGLGQFVIHDDIVSPTTKYLLSDLPAGFATPANHFEQDVWPALVNRIAAFPACTDLSDGPSTLGPTDFTGALQYPTGSPSDYLWMHWRNDGF